MAEAANSIRDFLSALSAAENRLKTLLDVDRYGIRIRSIINEFDWIHHNMVVGSSDRSQMEYYLLKLGLTKAINLSFWGRPNFLAPHITMARREEDASVAARFMYGLGMVEHGRRIAHFSKIGLAKIEKTGDAEFTATLPERLEDQDAHERSIAEHYRRQADSRLLEVLELPKILEIEKEAEKLFGDLVYVWQERFIGYEAHPLLDNHYLSIAYSLVRNMDGYDTFHYSTKFGGISVQKYILATTYFYSIALKHRNYCYALIGKAPHIRMEDILTISGDRAEFVESVKDAVNSFGTLFEEHEEITLEEADIVTQVLSVSRRNADILSKPAAPAPFLIQTSDSSLVQLLYGAQAEPLRFLMHSLRYHFPREFDKNQQSRENSTQRAMMRVLLETFENLTFLQNVKIKDSGRVLTDIDLVILDQTAGAIVLCQIKYQDDPGMDVLAMSSRANRLREESMNWLSIIESWLEKIEEPRLRSALRLPKEFRIQKVFKYVMAKSFAYPLLQVKMDAHSTFSNWIQLVNALFIIEQGNERHAGLPGLIDVLKLQNAHVLENRAEHEREKPQLFEFPNFRFITKQD